MNIEQQTARLQAANAALSAKGFGDPRVQIEHSVNVDGARFGGWLWYSINGTPKCETVDAFDTNEDALAALDKHIADLKTPEQEQRDEFLKALGRVIDQGRDAGIEVGFMNPLVQAMKDLSENILTDQR